MFYMKDLDSQQDIYSSLVLFKFSQRSRYKCLGSIIQRKAIGVMFFRCYIENLSGITATISPGYHMRIYFAGFHIPDLWCSSSGC